MSADLLAAARRIGEAVGHLRSTFVIHIPGDTCPGCRAERAALVELEAAVEAEREACAMIAVEKTWLAGELANRRAAKVAHQWSAEISIAIRARSAKIAEASHTPSGLGVKEEPA